MCSSDLKSMQPILRYSKNNKQLFCMVPKWLTSYSVIYVVNQWSTAFGPISNPSVFEVLYLVKYFGGFEYFISHDIKNRFKNAVTLPHTCVDCCILHCDKLHVASLHVCKHISVQRYHDKISCLTLFWTISILVNFFS